MDPQKLKPDWEKDGLVLVQPEIWRSYGRRGRYDLRPVYQDLTRALNELRIPYRMLGHGEHPLDIWIRDWGFVDRYAFVFRPSYAGSLYSRSAITRARETLARFTASDPISIPLVLDGGNLVHNGEIALVTEKVFADNPHLSRLEIERLFCSLGFRGVVFIPVEPGDIIGHADGMVRFVSRQVLLFNDYNGTAFSAHRRKLLTALRKARVDAELVPFPFYYTEEQNDGVPSAEGCYINFIETKRAIIYPTFQHRLDDRCAEVLTSCAARPIHGLKACELARFGGVLNCASTGCDAASLFASSFAPSPDVLALTPPTQRGVIRGRTDQSS